MATVGSPRLRECAGMAAVPGAGPRRCAGTAAHAVGGAPAQGQGGARGRPRQAATARVSRCARARPTIRSAPHSCADGRPTAHSAPHTCADGRPTAHSAPHTCARARSGGTTSSGETPHVRRPAEVLEAGCWPAGCPAVTGGSHRRSTTRPSSASSTRRGHFRGRPEGTVEESSSAPDPSSVLGDPSASGSSGAPDPSCAPALAADVADAAEALRTWGWSWGV